MADKKLHLELTYTEAKTIAITLETMKQFLAVPENTPVYPNLGDFKMERSLIDAQIKATQKSVTDQLEKQAPGGKME